MNVTRKQTIDEIHPFWGSPFIKGIPKEIQRMNETFGLELEYTVNQPRLIDGDPLRAERVVFVIKKRPWFLRETYCLFALYEDGTLYGFLGKLKGNEIKTLRKLGGIVDLEKGTTLLHKWLQHLIKTSCEKI